MQPKTKFSMHLSILCLCVGVISCASVAKSTTSVSISKNRALERSYNEALKESIFIPGDWPCKNWWAVFEDPQLSSYIETALEKNPSYQGAQKKVLEVQEKANIYRSKLFPQISAFFAFFWSHLGSTGILGPKGDYFHFYDTSPLISYTFDFWINSYNTYASYVGEAKAQEALSEQARLDLSMSVAMHYIDLQVALFQKEILQEMIDNRTKLLDLLRMRKEANLENLISINNQEVDISYLNSSLSLFNEQIAIEKSFLQTLMGDNPDCPLDVCLNWRESNGPINMPDDLGGGLLLRRADIAVKLWKVEAAAKMINASIGEFLPVGYFFALPGFVSFNISDLFNSFTPEILPVITMPIFTGGRLIAHFKEKVHAFEMAIYDYNDTILKAANEIVTNIQRIKSIQERLTYQNEDLRLSGENYDLVYLRQRHGLDSMINVLLTSDNYLKIKMKKIEYQKIEVQTIFQLIKALGGGFYNKDGKRLLKDYGK